MSTFTAEERDRVIIELEDWASRLSEEQWQAYLGGLPEQTADAYRSIVNSAYLIGYRSTLRILIGAIGVMLLVSLMLKRRDKTEAKDTG